MPEPNADVRTRSNPDSLIVAKNSPTASIEPVSGWVKPRLLLPVKYTGSPPTTKFAPSRSTNVDGSALTVPLVGMTTDEPAAVET